MAGMGATWDARILLLLGVARSARQGDWAGMYTARHLVQSPAQADKQ